MSKIKTLCCEETYDFIPCYPTIPGSPFNGTHRWKHVEACTKTQKSLFIHINDAVHKLSYSLKVSSPCTYHKTHRQERKYRTLNITSYLKAVTNKQS